MTATFALCFKTKKRGLAGNESTYKIHVSRAFSESLHDFVRGVPLSIAMRRPQQPHAQLQTELNAILDSLPIEEAPDEVRQVG